MAHHFHEARPEIEAKGEAEVLLVGRPAEIIELFRIQKQFLDDIEGHKLEVAIAGLGKALLVFHAPRDATVGIDNAARIFQAAKHPKSFVSLDDADHMLSGKQDAVYVAEVIAAWTERYIGEEVAEGRYPAPVAQLGTVVVAETGEGPFAQAISIGGRHVLGADEPEDYGGADSGPSPYDFLLAGLGACTSMTMRMYAQRKGLKLDRVAVTLRHEKAHADDCATCETQTGKMDHIERHIEIIGDLTAEERAKLMEIADKCPVHRTLHSEVWEESRLED